jgi:uncharacterized protein YcbK (DUF882 family)
VSAHFTRAEFACPHCGESFVRPSLVALLERIRAHYNRPLRIVSGYRCPVHNHAVGGAPDSQHVYGAAADLPLGIVEPGVALSLGATGIGVKRSWVTHVDVRDGAATRWSYPD